MSDLDKLRADVAREEALVAEVRPLALNERSFSAVAEYRRRHGRLPERF